MKNMQKTRKFFNLSILILIFCTPFVSMNANGAQDSTLSIEASAVVNQYFSALSNGDLTAIGKLLGPKLLKRRARLLSNPVYGSQLKKLYRNLNFEIKSKRVIDDLTVSVAVNVTYESGSKNNFRFTLKKIDSSGMRIIIEDEIP